MIDKMKNIILRTQGNSEILSTDMILKTLGLLTGTGGKLVGLSDESRKFYSSGYRCPKCDKHLRSNFGNIIVNFYSDNGKKIPIWKLAVLRAELAECPECSYRWKIRGSGKLDKYKTLEIFGIVETDRLEESLGTDNRIIDNSRSSAELTRKFTIIKEWSRTYSIEYEKAQVVSNGLNIGIDKITSIQTSFEETIKKQFSISDETKEVYSEEVQIKVPRSTKLNLVFHWKRIWQCGFIKFRNQDNEESKVPFRVVVGVTFDQTQIDENS